jgi:hypothetical protein
MDSCKRVTDCEGREFVDDIVLAKDPEENTKDNDKRLQAVIKTTTRTLQHFNFELGHQLGVKDGIIPGQRSEYENATCEGVPCFKRSKNNETSKVKFRYLGIDIGEKIKDTIRF